MMIDSSHGAYAYTADDVLHAIDVTAASVRPRKRSRGVDKGSLQLHSYTELMRPELHSLRKCPTVIGMNRPTSPLSVE